MKITYPILCGLALLLSGGSLVAATPVSADDYLVSPWDYEGQTIKLNVAFVRPSHFQSPLPDVIFYHAMTMTLDHKIGGEMLIAVSKTESEHFARTFGLDFHGRNARSLSGTLLLAHRPHPPFHRDQPNPQGSPGGTPEASGTNSNDTEHHRHEPGIWFVDYKGLNADLFSKHKDIELPEMGGPGPGAGQGPGPRWRRPAL